MTQTLWAALVIVCVVALCWALLMVVRTFGKFTNAMLDVRVSSEKLFYALQVEREAKEQARRASLPPGIDPETQAIIDRITTNREAS